MPLVGGAVPWRGSWTVDEERGRCCGRPSALSIPPQVQCGQRFQAPVTLTPTMTDSSSDCEAKETHLSSSGFCEDILS